MRASLAAAAVVLAACVTREPDTRPFRIEATRAGVGPVEAGIAQATALVYDGVARRQDDTTLDVALDGATGQLVTFTFHRDDAAEVAFPPQLDGQHVEVTVDVDPTHVGPEGESLPIHGLLVATTSPAIHYQFILGEFSSEDPHGLQIQPVPANQDAPWFHSVNDWAQFEPSECGPVYYDALQVIGDTGTITLRRGERGEISIGAAGQPPWKALNVMSWHRRSDCGAKPKAWTQLAAWR